MDVFQKTFSGGNWRKIFVYVAMDELSARRYNLHSTKDIPILKVSMPSRFHDGKAGENVTASLWRTPRLYEMSDDSVGG